MKIKPIYLFLFLGLLLFQVSVFYVNVSLINIYLQQIKLVSYLIFIFCIMLQIKKQKLDIKTTLLITILFVISAITYIKTSYPIFVEILLIFFATLNLDFNKILKADIFIKIFIIISLFIFNSLGLATSEFVVTRGEVIRNSYGFYHPNTFGMIIMITFFEFLYLFSNKLKIWHYILGIGLICLIEITSNTRTAMICIAILLLTCLFNKYVKKIVNNSIVEFFIKNLYLILLVISVIITLMYIYEVPLSNEINELLSNRVYLQSVFYNEYGITLFGNNIDYERTLDNGFLKVLLNFGIITSLFFIVIYWLTFKKCYKEKNYVLIYIFMILLFFSFSESSMFYIYNNIFMIYLFTNKKEVTIGK